jgi:hypothetical protein
LTTDSGAAARIGRLTTGINRTFGRDFLSPLAHERWDTELLISSDSMRKLILRTTTLLLIACLIVDPAVASLSPAPLLYSHHFSRFAQEALSMANQDVLHPLYFSYELHHAQNAVVSHQRHTGQSGQKPSLSVGDFQALLAYLGLNASPTGANWDRLIVFLETWPKRTQFEWLIKDERHDIPGLLLAMGRVLHAAIWKGLRSDQVFEALGDLNTPGGSLGTGGDFYDRPLGHLINGRLSRGEISEMLESFRTSDLIRTIGAMADLVIQCALPPALEPKSAYAYLPKIYRQRAILLAAKLPFELRDAFRNPRRPNDTRYHQMAAAAYLGRDKIIEILAQLMLREALASLGLAKAEAIRQIAELCHIEPAQAVWSGVLDILANEAAQPLNMSDSIGGSTNRPGDEQIARVKRTLQNKAPKTFGASTDPELPWLDHFCRDLISGDEIRPGIIGNNLTYNEKLYRVFEERVINPSPEKTPAWVGDQLKISKSKVKVLEDILWEIIIQAGHSYDLRQRVINHRDDPGVIEEFMNAPITLFPLSTRTYNCIANRFPFSQEHSPTNREILHQTEAEWLRVKNFGRKSLNELKALFVPYNFHLATPITPSGFTPAVQRLEPPAIAKLRKELGSASQVRPGFYTFGGIRLLFDYRTTSLNSMDSNVTIDLPHFPGRISWDGTTAMIEWLDDSGRERHVITAESMDVIIRDSKQMVVRWPEKVIQELSYEGLLSWQGSSSSWAFEPQPEPAVPPQQPRFKIDWMQDLERACASMGYKPGEVQYIVSMLNHLKEGSEIALMNWLPEAVIPGLLLTANPSIQQFKPVLDTKVGDHGSYILTVYGQYLGTFTLTYQPASWLGFKFNVNYFPTDALENGFFNNEYNSFTIDNFMKHVQDVLQRMTHSDWWLFMLEKTFSPALPHRGVPPVPLFRWPPASAA